MNARRVPWRRIGERQPAGTSVLVIVQNLPLPLDRRVWLECQALRNAGYRVSAICPKGDGDPGFQELDGIRLYKYRPPAARSGFIGYLHEFVYCWVRTALLSVVAFRHRRFDVIQACNPPDTYWALARLWKLRDVRFVYDQHDLNPELFRSRFGEPTGVAGKVQLAVLHWLERCTYRTADQVISTNESYRAIAMRRGGVDPADVTVVRSGPDSSVMRPVEGQPGLANGRRHLLVYLGIMGPQDNVDVTIRAMERIVHHAGRHDVQLALLGFGDDLQRLRQLTTELGLDEYVTFTGRVGPEQITCYLSSATVGLCPDLLSPLNNVSTMNKIMEYMSFALPVVSFDLVENRVSGGDAVVYLEPNEFRDDPAVVPRFADAIMSLLDAPARRGEMAVAGRRRVELELDWAAQAEAYVTAFDRVSRIEHAVVGRPAPRFVLADKFGRRYVDVADDASLFSFGATRSLVRPVPQTAPVGTRSFDGVAVHDPVQVSVVAHSRELASREAVVS